MLDRRLRPPVPRSLLPRAILIVIVPLIALQMIVAFVFVQRHFEGVTRQMTRNIARELAVAQQVIDTSPSAPIAQLRLDNLSLPLAILFELDAGPFDPGAHSRDWWDLSGRVLISEMEALLGYRLQIDLASDPRRVDTRLETDVGTLRAVIPRGRVSASNPHQLLVLMAVAAAILAVIAILFLRNQMRPILQLADASEAFGKGRNVPFRPAGAEEVRRAGNAFLSMRARIERAIEQRTLMLSGVSHDLRTPLTRMKLALALAEDQPGTAEMERDVEQMEEMVAAFLAFARGDTLEEMEVVQLPDLLENLGDRASRSGIGMETRFEAEAPEPHSMTMRASAVMRALENLIGNAGRYGTRVRFCLKLTSRTATFVVEDDGPGVPVEAREEVLRPFSRLDPARGNDGRGSVGLGMAIALDIARSHGGSLELGDSELGGLKCSFRLPR